MKKISHLSVFLVLILIGAVSGCKSSSIKPSTHAVAVETKQDGAYASAAFTDVKAHEKIRFVALGDTGAEKGEKQFAVAKAIKQVCEKQGCDFAILLGDNFYPGGITSVDDSQFQKKFEEPYRDLNFPFYVSLGNHDYDGVDFTRGIYQIRYTQKSKKWFLPAEFYSWEKHFSSSLVRWIALSSQKIIFQNQEAELESNFLAEKISAPANWKIVFAHHPFISNGPHGNAGNFDSQPARGLNYKEMIERHVCNQADLFLAGHDHNLQYLKSPKGCEKTLLLIAGGGGAGSYPLTNRNPSYFQKKSYGFIWVELEPKSLQFEFWNEKGKKLYQHSVKK